MKKNVGKFDRVLRVIIGLALILLALYFSATIGFWKWVLIIIGLILIIVGIIRYCPLYPLLKVNTNKK